MKYNAIIDRMLPEELRILQRRLDDLSILLLTETATEIDNDWKSPKELKEGISVSKSELMMSIFNSMGRIKQWMSMLKEEQPGKWN